MKYCKKCGMLLEDTHQTCIRCGTDVSKSDNVSMYPPEIMDQIEIRHEAQRRKGGIIAKIIAIFVVLLILCGIIIWAFFSGAFNVPTGEAHTFTVASENSAASEAVVEDTTETIDKNEDDAVAVDEVKAADEAESADEVKQVAETESADEVKQVTEAKKVAGVKQVAEAGTADSAVSTQKKTENSDIEKTPEVKDDRGVYYKIATWNDPAGHPVFTSVCPETLCRTDCSVDTGVYSNVFPEKILFKAENEDGGVKFSFSSMHQFWDRKSDYGQSSVDDEISTQFYMQFMSCSDAQGFIEKQIARAYSNAKDIELADCRVINAKAVNALKGLADTQNKAIESGTSNDAHIAIDARYSTGDVSYSANVYTYRITDGNGNKAYCEYYVPVLSNDIAYSSGTIGDAGVITEWLSMGVAAMECAEEDLYNQYRQAFEVFAVNCIPSRYFFYCNERYSDEINTAIVEHGMLDILDGTKLNGYYNDWNSGADLSDRYSRMYGCLASGSDRCFEEIENMKLMIPNSVKAGFYQADGSRVFISDEEDQYPGDDYKQLSITDKK